MFHTRIPRLVTPLEDDGLDTGKIITGPTGKAHLLAERPPSEGMNPKNATNIIIRSTQMLEKLYTACEAQPSDEAEKSRVLLELITVNSNSIVAEAFLSESKDEVCQDLLKEYKKKRIQTLQLIKTRQCKNSIHVQTGDLNKTLDDLAKSDDCIALFKFIQMNHGGIAHESINRATRIAALDGSIDNIDVLVKYGGADILAPSSKTGHIPMHHAIMRSHVGVVKFLLYSDTIRGLYDPISQLQLKDTIAQKSPIDYLRELNNKTVRDVIAKKIIKVITKIRRLSDGRLMGFQPVMIKLYEIINDKSFLERMISDILTELAQENIATSSRVDDSKRRSYQLKLEAIRKLTRQNAQEEKSIDSDMIASAATTFLKVGECREYAHRFALEYILASRNQDVSIVSLVNPNNMTFNHTIVLLGKVKVSHDTTLIDNKKMISVAELFSQIKECFIIDALNNSYINSADSEKMSKFLETYSDAIIGGVKSYSATKDIVELADQILLSAKKIATLSRINHNLMLLNLINSQREISNLNWIYHPKQNCYMLKNNKQEMLGRLQYFYLEKGFTRSEIYLTLSKYTGDPILCINHANALESLRLITIAQSMHSENRAKQKSAVKTKR